MTNLTVPRIDDFEVTGTGASPTWTKVPWVELNRVGTGTSAYATRGKLAYSQQALYFLFDCEDRRLTCTLTEDNSNIFTEDVIEVFLWPEASQRLYFEYEISPLGVQLPILVPNDGQRFHGWLPWHYEGNRVISAKTSVRGGPKASMAQVDGWAVEFRIPFALFVGLGNVPPKAGTEWRANLYRIDYDNTAPSQWAWCARTGGNFHDYRNFGTIVFG